MGYKLVFSINREMLHFLIVDKNIFYTDRKFKSYIRCLPKPDNFIKQIQMSRNKIPGMLGQMFSFSEAEIKEYNDAKDEEVLADIVIRDCKIKGATLILKAKEDNKNLEDVKFIS